MTETLNYIGTLATQYYGVDWLLFVLVLIHMYLLGERRREAWLVGIAVVTCAFVFGILVGSVATMTMNICFCMMHIRNWLKWKPIENRK